MSEKYSYSKIDTYAQCPFKYYLKYVEGHFVNSDGVATEVGKLIHSTEQAIAEKIVAKEPIDYTDLKNMIIYNLYQIKYKYKIDFSEKDKSGRTYQEKIYSYLETEIYNLENYMLEHPTYSIVGIEKHFKVEYNGKLFNGYIDRVFYDSATNKYIVQDIKTYAVEVEKSELTTPLQFVIYTLAAKELFNCTNEQISCQYYLPFCNLTQDAGTSGYMNRGLTKLNKLFEAIDNKDFEPKPCPLCNWCEFCRTNQNAPDDGKNLCPYYSLWNRITKNKYDISRVANKWEGLEKHNIIMENYKKEIENKEVK